MDSRTHPTSVLAPAAAPGLARHRHLGRLIRFVKGEVLLRQGEASRRGVFWLVSGQVKVSVVDEDGSERVIALVRRGAIFGEESILDGRDPLGRCEAVTDGAARFFDWDTLRGVMRRDPDLAVELPRTTAEKLRQTVRLVAEMSFLGVRERVAQTIARLADWQSMASAAPEDAPAQFVPVALKVTQQELAGLVGASRVMVSRALSDLTNTGAIERQRKLIIIQDCPRTTCPPPGHSPRPQATIPARLYPPLTPPGSRPRPAAAGRGGPV